MGESGSSEKLVIASQPWRQLHSVKPSCSYCVPEVHMPVSFWYSSHSGVYPFLVFNPFSYPSLSVIHLIMVFTPFRCSSHYGVHPLLVFTPFWFHPFLVFTPSPIHPFLVSISLWCSSLSGVHPLLVFSLFCFHPFLVLTPSYHCIFLNSSVRNHPLNVTFYSK
jgi:hypothetical protein